MFFIGDPWSTLKYRKNNDNVMSLPATISASAAATKLGVDIEEDETFLRHESAYVIIDVAAGDKLYLYALTCENDEEEDAYMTFNATADCYVYGNMMSLLSYENGNWNPACTTVPKDAFLYLFYYDEHFMSHSSEVLSLPATTLKPSCYSSMFSDCTNLAAAPDLPAMALADHCYQYMFHDCESLTAAPALPATALTGGCYYGMFAGCSSLETAPALPAENLADWCYMWMFSGCTSLTAAPVLPAATLAEACYSEMFNGCSQLASVTCLATDMTADRCTEDWLNNVAAEGTFTKATGAAWELASSDGIPSGWTVEVYSE